MKDSIRRKLETISERQEELGALLSEADVINNQDKFRAFSKEYAEIKPVVDCFHRFLKTEEAQSSAEEMLNSETDSELRAMAEEEMYAAKAQLEVLEQELQLLLLPKDPDDSSNIFLEVRAGTGGDEAAIFAGDLMRMYTRYAVIRGWQTEIMNESLGEHGGYKEVIVRISGENVYSQLKFESGGHRVQRVPETEAQGRIHTSACTVAILPEVEEIGGIEINPADLKVDTFRSSGAGGQHVNKTESAIRITHIPTGIVVECQEERSQHKNRAKAMSLLKARMLNIEKEKQQTEQSAARKLLVGSGDRSERIRTYNYPQGRVTDHRINLTLYKLEEVMQGNLDSLIQPIIHEYQMELLASMGD